MNNKEINKFNINHSLNSKLDNNLPKTYPINSEQNKLEKSKLQNNIIDETINIKKIMI